jgi:hypothetical protein
MDRETADEIKRNLTVFGEGLRTEIQDLRTEFQELRTENRTVRRHFDVVGEGLRAEIRIVAEGLQGLREETATEFKAVRDEISETRAMIRLSFADLDRRIR